MELTKKFISYIQDNQLFEKDDKLLLGLSGGLDSMVLAILLINNGFDVCFAHVNFQLRGEDAVNDELFVTRFAEQHKIRLHKASFDTKSHAQENKISVEMAARELRYEWMEEIRNNFNYRYILTAHHLNDNIETILLNFSKGTGIKGLRGILPKTSNIVRPLLFAGKEMLESFATEEQIEYCYDKSNENLDFQRNRIRHRIIPEFKQINPNFEQIMTENIKIYSSYEKLLLHFVKTISPEIVKDNKEIDINALQTYSFSDLLLYEFIKDFGFTKTTVNSIINSLTGETGKVFYSEKYKILKDRNRLLISENITEEVIDIEITDQLKECVIADKKFNFSVFESNIDNLGDLKNPSVAYLDYNKLSFPLRIRKWNDEDAYTAYGMSNSKKISDYLLDKKVSRFDKEKVLVVESGSEIVWIVDFQINNKYRIAGDTIKVFKIEKQ